MSSISEYRDATQWRNDPAKISDAELTVTREFNWLDRLFGSQRAPSTEIHGQAELLLGQRLILRDVHLRSLIVPAGEDDFTDFAMAYLDQARRQAGAARQAEQLHGIVRWALVDASDYAAPAKSRSDFLKWLLIPGQRASPMRPR